jgi:hypothetical protein
MRGAPHVGFSTFMRRISWRISELISGRPGRRHLDRTRQNNRNPARCQDTTVSGCTMIKASLHPDHTRRSTIQNSRSRRCNRGRDCFRLKTASCWRRATASRASLCRGRKKARMYATTVRARVTISPIIVELQPFQHDERNHLILLAYSILMTHTYGERSIPESAQRTCKKGPSRTR